jgi:signal peptidase I
VSAGGARQLLGAIFAALIAALFARTFVARALVVPTGSMAETLLVGDHLLVDRMLYRAAGLGPLAAALPVRPVARGDVVVIEGQGDPPQRLVKRCVGLPGDRIRIVDKRLFVNDRPVDERAYARHFDTRLVAAGAAVADPDLASRDNFGPYVVPAGYFFVLGDNRDESLDSRAWGAVAADRVAGRAWLVYWSRAPAADEPAPDSAWRHAFARLWAPLAETRWRRCFRPVR